MEDPKRQQKLSEAKQACQQFIESESELRDAFIQHMKVSHEFGKKLDELRGTVPPRAWQLCLHANFKELGDIEYRANHCVRIWAANDDESDPLKFEPGSVRKFFWYYLPPKKRPMLAGDQKDELKPHYLTAINEFERWRHRIEKGHDPMPPIDVIRRAFGPVMRRIKQLCGPDWVNSILADARGEKLRRKLNDLL